VRICGHVINIVPLKTADIYLLQLVNLAK
jgi:hypothetical protein